MQRIAIDVCLRDDASQAHSSGVPALKLAAWSGVICIHSTCAMSASRRVGTQLVANPSACGHIAPNGSRREVSGNQAF
jgi:hypothetical protein